MHSRKRKADTDSLEEKKKLNDYTSETLLNMLFTAVLTVPRLKQDAVIMKTLKKRAEDTVSYF